MKPYYSPESTDVILDCIADGVFAVDLDWRITAFNQAAERTTGVAQADALGRTCKEVLRADLCESGCVLRRTMETGEPIISHPVCTVDAQGQRKSITISTALLKDKDGLFQELITNTKVYVQQDLFRMLDVPGDAIQRIRQEGIQGRTTFLSWPIRRIGELQWSVIVLF